MSELYLTVWDIYLGVGPYELVAYPLREEIFPDRERSPPGVGRLQPPVVLPADIKLCNLNIIKILPQRIGFVQGYFLAVWFGMLFN